MLYSEIVASLEAQILSLELGACHVAVGVHQAEQVVEPFLAFGFEPCRVVAVVLRPVGPFLLPDLGPYRVVEVHQADQMAGPSLAPDFVVATAVIYWEAIMVPVLLVAEAVALRIDPLDLEKLILAESYGLVVAIHQAVMLVEDAVLHLEKDYRIQLKGAVVGQTLEEHR